MENPFKNFIEKTELEEILSSIGDFCDECPFEKTSSECLNCYLRPWLDKTKE